MNPGIDFVLVVLVLTNLLLLGSSRLRVYIRVVGFQGWVLAFLPLLVRAEEFSWHRPLLALATVAFKGVVFPWLLHKAMVESNVRREVEPWLGQLASLLLGTGLLTLSLWLGSRLPLPTPALSPLVVPVALSTMLIGLFVLITRSNAITEVVGYIVLENGIYTFGLALMGREPMLVELGVLLDVFVAVLVMGVTIFQIRREFDDLDTNRLASLHD